MCDGYVRSNYGCNCFYNDSSYKRYNRAHLEGDTLIFNFNYGYQGSCGGGCGMGFWGGVGLGLGNFFGNIFGGNMWGGGMPWVCNWGGGGSSSKVKDTDDGDYSSRRSRRSSAPDDIDNPKFADFTKRIKDLTPENIDTEYQKLKDEIKAAKEATDNLNKTADEQTYDNLLALLDTVKNSIKAGKGNPEVDLDEILNKNPLTDDDLSKLIQNFDRLTGPQKTKLLSLIKPNLNKYLKTAPDPNAGNYKTTRDYTDLLKFELLCKLEPSTVVDVENRDASTDKWIHGTISNVRKDPNLNGFIDYDVTDNTDDALAKGTWTCTCGSTKNGQPAMWITGVMLPTNAKDKYIANLNMCYDWDETKGAYVNNNNKATLRKS